MRVCLTDQDLARSPLHPAAGGGPTLSSPGLEPVHFCEDSVTSRQSRQFRGEPRFVLPWTETWRCVATREGVEMPKAGWFRTLRLSFPRAPFELGGSSRRRRLEEA